jgi:L-2-hydroxyglutarate oxidase LhgO
VTGLACAGAIARRGASVCVLDPHPQAGMETSTHNSGVIHAGLYYPFGTLKARLCVEGRDRLYDFCARHAVPARRTGKLVVARDDSELAALESLARLAAGNGAEVTWLDGPDARARVPRVRARAALLSPATGIVDASEYVRALKRLAESSGAIVLLNTPLLHAAVQSEHVEAHTPRETVRASLLVNAGGLYADDVSAKCGGERFTIWPCRGDYAVLAPSAGAVVPMPVYPLPHHSGHGLGIHFTPTTDGTILLGPTIKYQTSKTDCEEGRTSLAEFATAARELVPDLEPSLLREAGSGIRAKLHPPHESFADFMIRPDALVPRIIHAAGIDSPGLTASLAIGERVAALVDDRL